jgi:hypothetical protein
MTATLLTIASGSYEALLPLMLPTFAEYARLHGYELVVETEVRDATRPVAWSKIPAIREAFQTSDEVLWIDADALIVDFSRDLRAEVDPKTDLAWVVHRDNGYATPNAGVMLMRRSDAMLEFLDAVYEQVDLIDHRWWENGAMIRLLGFHHPFVPTLDSAAPALTPLVTQQLDPKWNSMRQTYSESVAIRHFGGYPMALRTLAMAELIFAHPGIPSQGLAWPQYKFDTQRHLGQSLDHLTTLLETEGAAAVELESFRIALDRAVADSATIRAEFTVIAGANDALRHELADATQALERQRLEFISSRSWKVTAPLRAMGTGSRRPK